MAYLPHGFVLINNARPSFRSQASNRNSIGSLNCQSRIELLIKINPNILHELFAGQVAACLCSWIKFSITSSRTQHNIIHYYYHPMQQTVNFLTQLGQSNRDWQIKLPSDIKLIIQDFQTLKASKFSSLHPHMIYAIMPGQSKLPAPKTKL